jgi:hypothetical protein
MEQTWPMESEISLCFTPPPEDPHAEASCPSHSAALGPGAWGGGSVGLQVCRCSARDTTGAHRRVRPIRCRPRAARALGETGRREAPRRRRRRRHMRCCHAPGSGNASQIPTAEGRASAGGDGAWGGVCFWQAPSFLLHLLFSSERILVPSTAALCIHPHAVCGRIVRGFKSGMTARVHTRRTVGAVCPCIPLSCAARALALVLLLSPLFISAAARRTRRQAQ